MQATSPSTNNDADLRSKLAQTATYLGNPPTAPTTALKPNSISLPPIQDSAPTAHARSASAIEQQHHLHPQLRASPNLVPTPDMMQRGIPSPTEEPGHVSASPPDGMAAQGMMSHDPNDPMNDGRSKAKRELSQSKRAAQNRAAQRAFRQRKEHYIKKLEEQVRNFGEMEQSFKGMQNDNYLLREYVIQLQSRLLDMQVEPPPPPPGVNLNPPASGASSTRNPHPPSTQPPPPAPVSEVGPNNGAAGTLADVAAAVAGLRAREPAADGLYPKPPI